DGDRCEVQAVEAIADGIDGAHRGAELAVDDDTARSSVLLAAFDAECFHAQAVHIGIAADCGEYRLCTYALLSAALLIAAFVGAVRLRDQLYLCIEMNAYALGDQCIRQRARDIAIEALQHAVFAH